MISKQETVKSSFSSVNTSISNGGVQPSQNAENVMFKYNQAIQHNSLTQQGWQRLLAQSDDNLKAYLISIKGTAATISGYKDSLQANISGFEKVTSAIAQYNALSASGAEDQNAFAAAVSATNNRLGTYLAGLNGAKANLSGYAVSLLGATVKTIALQAATIALNAALTMGISAIISGIVTAFTAWMNKSEKIAEKAQEAADRINAIKDSLKSNIETVDNAKHKYAELAQEVENLGKVNQNRGTLSNEDYEEFLDLSNQLAEVFPSLSKNYDENGNAILNLSGNVDTIVSSLDNLIQKEKELTNQEMMEDFPDVFSGWTQDVSNTEQAITNAQTEFDKIDQAYRALENGRTIQMGFTSLGYTTEGTTSIAQYENWLETLGLSYTERIVSGGKVVEAVGNINTAFTSELETARGNLEYAQQKLEGQISSINSYLNTWLQTEFIYNQIDDIGLQQAVQDMLFNFDWSSLPEDIDKEDWDEVSEYFRKNILFAINNVQDNEEIANALSQIYSNAELTPEENANYIKQIQDYFGEGHAVTLSLQPQLEEAENLEKQYQDAIDYAQDKFDGYDSTEFFKEQSINTQEELDAWQQIAENASNAAEAEQEYLKWKPGKKNTSYSDVFNSTDFASTKEELLDLAKSGEITPEILESNADYAALLKETGLSAEDAANQVLDMLSVQEKLAGASNGLEHLASAYEEFNDLGFVTATTLESLPDAFKTLDGYDLFSQIVGDPTSGNEKIQQAFNDIVKQYLVQQDTLSGLVNASESEIQSYIANLKQMHITNAEELVNQTIAALSQENELINAAESEYYDMYLDYIQGKSDLDMDYLESIASNNGQLAQALGSAYKSDYDNWCDLLAQKASAYNEFVTALGGSYDPSKSIIQNMLDNGQPVTANNIVEAETAKAEYDKLMRQAEEQKAQLKFNYNTIKTNFGTNFNLSSSESGSSSATEAAQETAETFNWLETLLSRIQRKITNFGKTVSAVWQSWSKRNNAAIQQLAAIREELSAQQQAYDAYLAKADSVGLSGYYQDLVKNGSIRIEDITDDSLKEQIKAFQDWYEKALAASDAIADLKDNLADLAKTRFDNVSKQFEQQLSLIEHEADLTNNRLEQAEAKGYLVSGSYYEFLIALEEDTLAQLKQQHAALWSTLQTSVADGTVELYSEQWYDWVSDIQKVEKDIGDAELSIINNKNKLRELDWDLFDRSQEQMAQIPKEADFLLSLMENSDLYDESGSLNRLGNAAAGLHAVSLNTYMAQADDYAKEIASIDRELAEDPYNTILLDRRKELLGLQQDMISSAEDERQAIKDLVSDGYSRMLDFLSDIIDKRKEALQAEKNLYDYQKSIAEQTKAVSTYEKQLAAFSGDDSEETKNTIQQIRVSLEEARQGLEDTEYDKWLSDQEQLLDQLQDDTQEWVNARLDDIDGLIQDVIDSTNANAGEIKETLEGLGEDVGYHLSENMEKIWNTDSGVGQVVSQYSRDFNFHATTVQHVLADILKSLLEMNGASKKQAEKDVAGIQQGSASLPGVSNAPSGSPGTGSPSAPSSGSSSNNSSSSSSWGSWFTGKKDSYPKSKLNVDTSIVDRLKSLDLDSSFSQRKRYYSAMGGSGTYTGSASQNTWMLEQMKLHGYAEGSNGIPDDRLAWTQEKGGELIYRAADGALLTPLGKGDMVFTSEMTQRLWDLSKLPPVRPSLPQIPTLQDVYLPVPEDIGSHASGNVTVQIDNIEMNGVNDPEQFTQELTKALSSDRRVKQILVDETIGRSLGRNSLLSRSR